MTARRIYTVSSPLATHYREATCAEIDCPPYLNGWRVRVDTLPEDVAHAARTAGRHYEEVVLDFDPDTGQHYDPPATFLVFEAGQPCFASRSHTIAVGRPELYVIRSEGQAPHQGIPVSAQSWVDDCGEHVERLTDKIKEG